MPVVASWTAVAGFMQVSGVINPARSMNASVSAAADASSSSTDDFDVRGECRQEVLACCELYDRRLSARGIGRRGDQVNVAGSRIEDGPIGRIVVAGPHEIGGDPPRASVHQQVDKFADAGQLAVGLRVDGPALDRGENYRQTRERGAAQESPALLVRDRVVDSAVSRISCSGRNLSAINDARDDSTRRSR